MDLGGRREAGVTMPLHEGRAASFCLLSGVVVCVAGIRALGRSRLDPIALEPRRIDFST